MPSSPPKNPPPDQTERERAVDGSRSILVRAPAGSGKTGLLTRRYLCLLSEVNEPGQIVAITFTKAAAAEMRHRILSELEGAATGNAIDAVDPFSAQALARRALAHSQALGWNLLDLPAQLRISTIDSFCRELALQQPLLSGLGGGLAIFEQPTELYRRAARRTLEEIDGGDRQLGDAIEALLLWRDNRWQDLEAQLIDMLAKRDHWMHDFVLDRDPDWDVLRGQLERPFAREAHGKLAALSLLLDQVPGAREEALELARFACGQSEGRLYQDLAELAEFPRAPFQSGDALEDARQAHACLANLLLTGSGGFRKQVNVSHGFPKESKAEKARLAGLIASLAAIPGLESALAAVHDLPPARYTDEEWEIVKACFTLLRRAAGQLQVVFAEAAAADFIEVAQIALNVLKGEDGLPSNATLAVADGIRHLLVDEFQDTSRRQHQLLAHLIAAWPGREGRTCFVVGDPMQSIYFFRAADAELFPRVEQLGLEIPGDLPLRFDPARLTTNFRTQPPLLQRLNETFVKVFAVDDGSGVTYTKAEPPQADASPTGPHLVMESGPRMELHIEFMPQSLYGRTDPDQGNSIKAERETAHENQTKEIVALIRGHLSQIEKARAENESAKPGHREKKKYRIAVLGRTHKALALVAEALRQAGIPFRAVELEELKQRPEIIDALALARALLNPQDRVAWLGVLRAPWCGLSLADLHMLGGDDAELLARPVPELLAGRIQLLSVEGRAAAERVLRAVVFAQRLRSTHPAAAIGTWLERVWLRLGGAQCVDAVARANLDLLWSCLDSLTNSEQDLLGPALDAALGDLKALPDPAAESDYGVQLMTIHKAKGLEFEVVIVPELQAMPGRGKPHMLSWLERGLPPESDASGPDDSGEITEFLVAPFQQKGVEGGKAKEWVDRIRREREKQETRRLLYVACTRAREELHLFARPSYKTAQDGSLSLCDPPESLLKTAWPAFEEEVKDRFDQRRSANAAKELAEKNQTEKGEETIETIAASGEEDLLAMPSPNEPPPAKPVRLRRLPPDYRAASPEFSVAALDAPLAGAGRLYERHEGGLLSRALGKAVHVLLQQLAQLLITQPLESARAALARSQPRIAAEARAAGVEPQQAVRIATQALQIARQAAADPVGEWILSPHAAEASEVRWTGVVAGSLHTVQVDRVFRAGLRPRSAGDEAWWIIDYKTAHAEGIDADAALPALREIFAPQIEAYAQVLRNLHGADAPIYAGLYYPRMLRLDWWEI